MRLFLACCLWLLVGTGAGGDAVDFLGVVAPAEQVEVAAEVEGTLRSLAVSLGDTVASGQELAVLEVQGIGRQIARAEAALRVARSSIETAQVELDDLSRQLERREKIDAAYAQEELETLRAQHRVKSGQLDRAVAQAAEQEATLGELQERAAAQTVRAPFDGVVAMRHQSAGAYVRVGETLLRLVSLGRPIIRFAVPVERSHWLAVGAAVQVRSEAGPVYAARVARVSPEVDTALDMIFAEAEFAPEVEDHAIDLGAVVRVRPATAD